MKVADKGVLLENIPKNLSELTTVGFFNKKIPRDLCNREEEEGENRNPKTGEEISTWFVEMEGEGHNDNDVLHGIVINMVLMVI